jgi:hypothetical protein
MIFKVQGPKCIFYETYGTPPMFDAFFISVHFLSISPFHKKSKAIRTKLSEKKFKDQIEKKLYSSSTIMCERMNNKAFHNEKIMPFRVILIRSKKGWTRKFRF